MAEQKYRECICETFSGNKQPRIRFEDTDRSWYGGYFVMCGERPGFGTTVRRNESDNEAINRLLKHEIKDLDSQIRVLQKMKEKYEKLMTKYPIH